MSSEFSADIAPADLVSGLNPIEQMAKVWNQAVPGKTLITTPFPIAASTGYADLSNFRDAEIGIYKSHPWYASLQSGAIAITQYYGVVTSTPGLGQYIDMTHADIIVNYRDYGSEFTMSNNSMYDYDLPTVLLHELGHLVGLCHETKKPSIMAPYYLTTQRSLQAYDKDVIKDIYVDGAITRNMNVNALSIPVGTEVKGTIELHADGKCVHFLNGEKTLEHKVEMLKKKKLAQK